MVKEYMNDLYLPAMKAGIKAAKTPPEKELK
jgi:hypothetical protein